MEERRINLDFTLCNQCLSRLDSFYSYQNKLKGISKEKAIKLSKTKNISFSNHVQTKENSKKNEITRDEILHALYSGDPIEYQSTRYTGECKIIFRSGNFKNRPLHIVVLFSPLEEVPKIITVYDPTILAWWKWDDSYRRRIYINQFRTCCAHPLDSHKAHNKKHHSQPYHPIYTWKR